ncbi:hypothetical protein GY45DRAFT_203868 [Cubamyces sp. BRFM 1775]|nr:hypothetical protein GY45DRAFT_203868 [Cubamyces sp. BRFM 1775]
MFPNLTSLKILRYRQQQSAGFDVERFAEILRPLGSLCELSLHLDQETIPHLVVEMRTAILVLPGDAIGAFSRTLDNTADVLAHSLGPSVKLVKFLQPLNPDRRMWTTYRIIRDEHGSPPRAKYDRLLTPGGKLAKQPIVQPPPSGPV